MESSSEEKRKSGERVGSGSHAPAGTAWEKAETGRTEDLSWGYQHLHTGKRNMAAKEMGVESQKV